MQMVLTERQPRSLPRRLWSASVTFLTTKVPMWMFLSLALAGILLYSVLSSRAEIVDRRAREADLDQVLVNAYLTEYAVYQASVTNRLLCETSVAGSQNNRAQWEALAVLVDNQFGSVDGQPAGDLIRTGPLLLSPKRTLESCPAILPVPVPPPGLQAGPVGQ